MKFTKSSLTQAAILAVCVLFLTSCGGGGGDNSKTAVNESSSGPSVDYEADITSKPYIDPDSCPSGQTLDETKTKCVSIDMCKSFGVCK